MAFAQRRARLKAALSSRPPEVRAYVERQLKDLTQLNTPMRQAWDKMKIDCYDIRMTTLAARMAVTEETSQWLLEDAQARKGSADEKSRNSSAPAPAPSRAAMPAGPGPQAATHPRAKGA